MKTKQPHVVTRSELEHKIQIKKTEIANYKEIAEAHPGTSLWKPGYMARMKSELNHYMRLLKRMA